MLINKRRVGSLHSVSSYTCTSLLYLLMFQITPSHRRHPPGVHGTIRGVTAASVWPTDCSVMDSETVMMAVMKTIVLVSYHELS